jgi:tRNA pseudouridine55 synthase
MIHQVNGGWIVNINKPAGWTSFDVVKKVRNITRIRKVGHAGTLDPFATGVLLICLNRATKLTETLMTYPKEYLATLHLGQQTDTLDLTGTVVEQQPVPELTGAAVEKVLAQFTGKIRQRIPEYSASKIGGVRRYKLARQGKEVPVEYKTVEIYQLELVELAPPEITFRVLCSRGTYVRVLGADIARALGTVGHLRELVRTRVGDYSLQESLTISEFENVWKEKYVHENFSSH